MTYADLTSMTTGDLIEALIRETLPVQRDGTRVRMAKKAKREAIKEELNRRLGRSNP